MHENMVRNLSSTITVKPPMKCFLEEHAWQKMTGWCKAAKSEVSGMGLCKIVRGNFVVYDVFFPLQYGSSGYTELDDRALAKLQIALYNKKIPADHFRFWWHTHYNFNVFWSGTDDGNATTLAKANGQWELSLVINQANEYRCRADYFVKVHPRVEEKFHVLMDEIEVMTIPNSKRQRRKPNFRADVRKWVKPMSALPEKQKPKTQICAPVQSWEYSGGYSGSEMDMEEYWEKRFSGESRGWEKQDKQQKCEHCASYFCDNGKTCKGGKKEDWERGLDGDKKWSDLQDGDAYGGFIFYRGFLVSKGQYERISKAVAEEGLESHPIECGAPKDEPCLCGDGACVGYDMCVPCNICGGRVQASNGYCPGCYEHYGLGGTDAESKSKIASE